MSLLFAIDMSPFDMSSFVVSLIGLSSHCLICYCLRLVLNVSSEHHRRGCYKYIDASATTEAGLDSPFDSINKMYFLGNKANDSEEREWLFAAIADLHQAGTLRPGELAATVLNKKNVQYADVLVFKKQLLDELLHAKNKELGLSKDTSSMLHTVLQSHKSYRNLVGFQHHEQGRDASWSSQLSRAGIMYCQLIEELIYGTFYDMVIKQILKLRKSASEGLAYGTIGSELNCPAHSTSALLL